MRPDEFEIHNNALGMLRFMLDDMDRGSVLRDEDLALRVALVRHAKGMVTAYEAWLNRKKSRLT